MALLDELLSGLVGSDVQVAAPGSDLLGAAARRGRAARADAVVRRLWASAALPERGAGLLAVGGYGRGELSPGSDLDLLLVHEPGLDVEAAAKALWYPLWDAGVHVDHSVRTADEARQVAGEDLAVVLGLLEARPLAGDADLAGAAVAKVLADWRARAPRRLGPLRGSCAERALRAGEVAFALEPDLKEGRGGLRDAGVLRAVAASWIADRPHGRVDGATVLLADVRDALHLSTGRATDRLVREAQPEVAELMGFADADDLRRAVSAAGRDLAHALDGMWRRVVPGADGRRRRRVLVPGGVPRARLAPGVDTIDGEVVLGRDARLEDPVLPLRLAAAAAQAGLVPSPATVEALAGCPQLPRPWPTPARDALVSLLGAGSGLVAVWEEFDRAGLVERWLPEWGPVRSLPQRSPVHRWTVDRHLVETAAAASQLTRRVRRPDLLLLGALLHDLGKATAGLDHSEVGVAAVGSVAARLGLSAGDTGVLVALTRHHLLLPTVATRRDLDDPATIASVVSVVEDPDLLDLLHALTEADAKATSPAAWTSWRASLIGELVARSHAALRGVLPSDEPAEPVVPDELRRELAAGGTAVTLRGTDEGASVTVLAPDRTGLLALVAGVLALHRLAVRSAVVGTYDGTAVQQWQVEPQFGDRPDAAALRESVRRALDGRLDVSARLAVRDAAYRLRQEVPPARVEIVEGASVGSTVVEIRAHDAPGLLHRIASAVAAVGVDIRSARVATWGAEVVDALYLIGRDGAALPPARAAGVVAAISAALEED